MQPEPAESRWQQWGRILFLGVLLGVLQVLALIVAPLLAQRFDSLWPAILVSAFFYLLISAIAGFMAADRRGTIASGILDACLVGGVSFLNIATLVAVLLMAGSITPQPVCSNCVHRFYIDPGYIAYLIVPPSSCSRG
jgi:hypothetical protein